LLEAGYPNEAVVIYWEDLRKSPANGYSLFGLQQALEALGDTTQAARMAEKFAVAWSAADVQLTSSRF
jgi:two-component SAPR family response regulator